MGTLYNTFDELKKETELGRDYAIVSEIHDSNVLIMAIHGGGIEAGCSELAVATAEDGRFSYYCFEGIRRKGNQELHVSSTQFDEPEALRMAAAHSYSLAYHGYEEAKWKHTLVGGADRSGRKKVCESLIAAGFSAEVLPDASAIAGVDARNIVNRNKRGMGVQLELSTAQREVFFGTNNRLERGKTQTDEFHRYVEAVCNGIR
ncbi:poly-gamma-glutamate hydrolase family protein [Halobacillus sp. B23F22_1]|uniref:poly-gamma-glutamate hydrolase family protein n=1 Tax=Halobacillus sp. B23F22_1 TaxID=3459514 RepID=UPI00373E5EEF